MNSIWKTLFVYLPFIIVLMVFYWMIKEIEIEYPSMTVNNEEIMYDINYKYKTTLIPFVYDFVKEDRQSRSYLDGIGLKKVKYGTQILIEVSEMKYDITDMYIVYEGEELKTIYEGNYTEDITKFLTETGVYRISLYCKLYKRFYYDGYVDYKFKIEVMEA